MKSYNEELSKHLLSPQVEFHLEEENAILILGHEIEGVEYHPGKLGEIERVIRPDYPNAIIVVSVEDKEGRKQTTASMNCDLSKTSLIYEDQ